MKILIGYDGPMSAIATDAPDVDDSSEQQARKLAGHGAELARSSGFGARAMWVADDRDVTNAIVDEAIQFDADLVVVGARGLTGVRAFLGSVSNHVLQHSHRRRRALGTMRVETENRRLAQQRL